MKTPGFDSDWIVIENLLPSRWRALAEENGVRLDPRPEFGGKMADLSILLRLILHHVCTHSSLEVTTSLAAALGLINISAVALHKWMRKCGPWIAAIVAAMLESEEQFGATRWAGYEIVAADATSVQRPGADGTTARVHYAIRLADLRSIAIHVTDIHTGETLRNFNPRSKQLWLLDRGYCNANSIAHAATAGAAVLMRFCVGPLPLFDHNGEGLNARSLMRKATRVNVTQEHLVFVKTDTNQFIEGRLLITKLPAPATTKARERLVRERGRKHVTEDASEQANYVMLFTTAPATRLSAEQLMILYRLRWQVELSFKRDKSLGGLDQLPNFRDDTIHTWICSMMLGQVLGRRLAGDDEPFPPSIVGHYAVRPTSAAVHSIRL